MVVLLHLVNASQWWSAAEEGRLKPEGQRASHRLPNGSSCCTTTSTASADCCWWGWRPWAHIMQLQQEVVKMHCKGHLLCWGSAANTATKKRQAAAAAAPAAATAATHDHWSWSWSSPGSHVSNL